MSGRTGQSGVTLLEMIVVVSLIAVMIGITFPAIASGLDSLRLRSASDDIVSVLNAALIRANREQDAVQITVSQHNRAVVTQTVRTNIERRVDLPEGIQITGVLPAPLRPDDPNNLEDVRFFIYPDGSVPDIAIDLVNAKGFHRLVAVDPITGVARESPKEAAQ